MSTFNWICLDSFDFYSEVVTSLTAVTEQNRLDSEPLSASETRGIGEGPTVCIVKDDAISDGEESDYSDYDFEIVKLFAWLDKYVCTYWYFENMW